MISSGVPSARWRIADAAGAERVEADPVRGRDRPDRRRARPLSCHDTSVMKCVAVSAIAAAVGEVRQRAVGVVAEQHPQPVGPEHLDAPAADRVGDAVGVDGADEQRARRLELGDDLGFDHDGSGDGNRAGRQMAEVANS